MSSPDNGAQTNGPARIRTSDQWIMSPLDKNDKPQKSKDLEQGGNSAYTPAYKDNPNDSLPSELIEIIEAWNELPEHVKKTICTLVSVTSKEKSQ